MKTSHVAFASGTALVGGRAFAFSLTKVLFTQEKNPVDQFKLGFILIQSGCLWVGPQVVCRSEEWMESLEEGGLRLPKVVPKLVFHQARKR